MVAGGHDASQVDGTDFKILGYRDRLLDDRSGQNPRDDYVFVGFEDVGGAVAVDLADGLGQLG